MAKGLEHRSTRGSRRILVCADLMNHWGKTVPLATEAIALDLSIDGELQRSGLLHDVVRQVQEIRRGRHSAVVRTSNAESG